MHAKKSFQMENIGGLYNSECADRGEKYGTIKMDDSKCFGLKFGKMKFSV